MNNQNITIFHDSDSQEPYSPLFTDSQIKGRLRVIDTSTDTWDIGESEAILINFNLLNVHNVELIDQFKYTIAWFVKSKSPSHALACSGQLKLATVLEFSQYNRSDSLGVKPPLY
ncbi:integrase [Vibrio cholerae]|nr:integrase [Vibrio cholerae]